MTLCNFLFDPKVSIVRTTFLLNFVRAATAILEIRKKDTFHEEINMTVIFASFSKICKQRKES